MSRFLRYLLIWLSCTAASVTAVIITVHFVVGSTRPTAPVAQSAPTDFAASARASATARPDPTPSASASTSPDPTPSKRAEKPRTATPTPAARTSSRPPDKPSTPSSQGCEEGGSGVHTISSQGGSVTVRYGSGGVCLISAVPSQGFTASTAQSAPDTLTVTFAGSRHRSEITATTVPVDRASVRETSF